MTKRERLKQFLLTEIDVIKESANEPDAKLLEILYAAVEGLENLEFGQVDGIFAPAKTGFHGLRPATVKRYEAHAVGSVLTLKRRGYKIAAAEETVASAYGIEPDALHKWRSIVPKTKDPTILEIFRSYKYAVKFAHEPRLRRVLADIRRKGKIYRGALAGKMGKSSK